MTGTPRAFALAFAFGAGKTLLLYQDGHAENGSMAWRIGIDEAGYGPNLGPLVMTAVACRVPDDLIDADLWKVLKKAVRRRRLDGDTRLFIQDSKLVFSTTRGLGDLETAVLAALVHCSDDPNPRCLFETLAHLLDFLCPTARDEIEQELWFSGTTGLPVSADAELLRKGMDRLCTTLSACGVRLGPVRSMVFCPDRFNQLVDHWGSKGSVLAVGLNELLRWQMERTRSGPVRVVVDKHGGRNCYAAVVQEAFDDGMVLAREEGANRSVYELVGLERPVRLTFMPRADGSELCVALASMISKYLRELFMVEFNAFWQKELPGLEPTAGYPGDAARFFEAISPVRQRLGVPDRLLWRSR
jgi:ribonuclease HII